MILSLWFSKYKKLQLKKSKIYQMPKLYLLLRWWRWGLGCRWVVTAVIILWDPELQILSVPFPLYLTAGATLLLNRQEAEGWQLFLISYSFSPFQINSQLINWRTHYHIFVTSFAGKNLILKQRKILFLNQKCINVWWH